MRPCEDNATLRACGTSRRLPPGSQSRRLRQRMAVDEEGLLTALIGPNCRPPKLRLCAGANGSVSSSPESTFSYGQTTRHIHLPSDLIAPPPRTPRPHCSLRRFKLPPHQQQKTELAFAPGANPRLSSASQMSPSGVLSSGPTLTRCTNQARQLVNALLICVWRYFCPHSSPGVQSGFNTQSEPAAQDMVLMRTYWCSRELCY